MITYDYLYGYSAQCVTVFDTILTTNIGVTPTSSSIIATQQSVETLHAIFSINLYSQILTNVKSTYQSILALPFNLPSADLPYFNNRVSALTTLINDLNALLPNLNTINYSNIANGNNIFATVDLIAALWNFPSTDVPSGTTIANFMSMIVNEITAWTDLQNAMTTQNITWTGEQYDAVKYTIDASEYAYNHVSNITLNTSADPTFSWNSFVFLPTMFSVASIYLNDPTSFYYQDAVAFKYLLLNTLQQLNSVVLQLDTASTGNINTGTFLQNDSLMTFAYRETGNFEEWNAVATANNLTPPYTSTTQQEGFAYPGETLFLPGNTIATNSSQSPNYNLDYLGTDIYFGPLNQDLTIWTGDFQTISGYNNLTFSLGRALQTAYGTLMYEPGFGSRIPDEIGNITWGNPTSQMTAYAESSILFDPRVNSIQDAFSSYDPSTQSLSFNALVIPNGVLNSGIKLDTVITPI